MGWLWRENIYQSDGTEILDNKPWKSRNAGLYKRLLGKTKIDQWTRNIKGKFL
jgi:hypothetical protein